jgi:hypothetical protein
MSSNAWRERLRRWGPGKHSSRISSGDINHKIYTAQIEALYQHTPMVLAVNVVNSALVALVLTSYTEQTRWWVFFGSVVTLTAVRAIGWSRHRHNRKPDEATTKWATVATAGSGLSGLLWA